MKLSDNQAAAIEFALSSKHKVVFIEGSAGTGKSFVLTQLISALYQTQQNFVCCAPTHKAVKVIRDRIKDPNQKEKVETLASVFQNLTFSEYQNLRSKLTKENEEAVLRRVPKRNKLYFSKNSNRQDITIIDETSMVSLDMLEHVVKNSNKVICFGDPNQIPPVKGISAYRYKETHPDCSFTLTDVFRTDNNKILELGNILTQKKSTFNDFIKYAYESNLLQQKSVAQLAEDRSKYNSDHMNITFYNWIRREINHKFNSHTFLATYQTLPLHYNSVVKHPKTGEVEHYPLERLEDKPLLIPRTKYKNNILFDDSRSGRVFTTEDLCPSKNKKQVLEIDQDVIQLTLPHCITIHKSQGSEYKSVNFIARDVVKRPNWRNLCYTAITRAKENLIITI